MGRVRTNPFDKRPGLSGASPHHVRTTGYTTNGRHNPSKHKILSFFEYSCLAQPKICDMKDAVFELAILGSGSSGNSALITTENCRILGAIGFSARRIGHRVEALSVAPATVDP